MGWPPSGSDEEEATLVHRRACGDVATRARIPSGRAQTGGPGRTCGAAAHCHRVWFSGGTRFDQLVRVRSAFDANSTRGCPNPDGGDCRRPLAAGAIHSVIPTNPHLPRSQRLEQPRGPARQLHCCSRRAAAFQASTTAPATMSVHTRASPRMPRTAAASLPPGWGRQPLTSSPGWRTSRVSPRRAASRARGRAAR